MIRRDPDQSLVLQKNSSNLVLDLVCVTVSPSREVHQLPHDYAAVFATAYKPPRAPRLFLSSHLIIITINTIEVIPIIINVIFSIVTVT